MNVEGTTSMDIGGRVASGTATEKMSGSAKPTRRVHIFETRMTEGIIFHFKYSDPLIQSGIDKPFNGDIHRI